MIWILKQEIKKVLPGSAVKMISDLFYRKSNVFFYHTCLVVKLISNWHPLMNSVVRIWKKKPSTLVKKRKGKKKRGRKLKYIFHFFPSKMNQKSRFKIWFVSWLNVKPRANGRKVWNRSNFYPRQQYWELLRPFARSYTIRYFRTHPSGSTEDKW